MTSYGPYTPVRQAGNLLFVSGQVGIDPKTKTAANDISSQAEQALTNLSEVLENIGSNINDIIKTTIFLTDIKDFQLVNEIYEKYFMAPRPARSCVEVKALPKVAGKTKLLIEIEAVAYKETSNE